MKLVQFVLCGWLLSSCMDASCTNSSIYTGIPWEGYGRDGLHSGYTPFTLGDMGTLRPLWEIQIGGPVQNIAVGYFDTVFVGTLKDPESGTSAPGFCYALSIEGVVRWSFPVGDVQGSPLLVDDSVVFGDSKTDSLGNDDSRVFSLEMKTGALRWQYPTASRTGSSLLGAVRSSPTLSPDGRYVYVMTSARCANVAAGCGLHSLLVLDASDGSLRYRYETGEGAASTPLVFYFPSSNGSDGETDEERFTMVYFVSGETLYALQETWGGSGEVGLSMAWSAPIELSESGTIPSPSLVPREEILLIGCGWGVCAFNLHTGARRWRTALTGRLQGGGCALLAAAGGQALTETASASARASAVGVAYCASDSFILSISLRDGGVVWRYRTSESGSSTDVVTGAPTLLGDGTLVVPTQGWILRLLASGTLLERVRLPGGDLGGGTASSSTPALARVVASSGGVLLYAGSSDKAVLALAGGGNGVNAPSATAGGCAGGTVQVVTGEVEELGGSACCACAPGEVAPGVGMSECTPCGSGWWSDEWGMRGCTLCESGSWCEGGLQCALGRAGAACALCSRTHFMLGRDCYRCPQQSRALVVLALVGVAALTALLLRAGHRSPYSSGTRFSRQISAGDAVRVNVRTGERRLLPDGSMGELLRKPVLAVVVAVRGDTAMRLDEPVSDFEERDVRFQVRPYRRTGRGRWRTGVGLLHLRASSPVVLGRPSSALQIFCSCQLIALGWLQTVALLLNIPLRWPSAAKDPMAWISALASFNIRDVHGGLDCEASGGGTGWHLRELGGVGGAVAVWGLAAAAPLLPVVGLLLYYTVSSRVHQSPFARLRVRENCRHAALLAAVLLHAWVVGEAGAFLRCVPQSPLAQTHPGGDSVGTLALEPSVLCDLENDEYYVMALASVLLLLIYGAGLPLWLWLRLSRARRRHQLADASFQRRYGWLYLRFSSERYYWEAARLARQLIFILARLSNFSNGPSAQGSAVLPLLLLGAAAQAWIKPYMCYVCLRARKRYCRHWGANDRLDVMGQLVAATLLALGLERGADRPSSGGGGGTGRVAVDSALSESEGDEASAALLLLLFIFWLLLYGRVSMTALRQHTRDGKEMIAEASSENLDPPTTDASGDDDGAEGAEQQEARERAEAEAARAEQEIERILSQDLTTMQRAQVAVSTWWHRYRPRLQAIEVKLHAL